MAARYATAAEVVAIAPELAGNALLDPFLEIAEVFVPLAPWASQCSTAHALVTAHLVATHPASAGTAAAASVGGAVSAESLGPASVTYATPTYAAGTDPQWTTSHYGRLFVALRQRIIGPTMAGSRGQS